MEVLFLMCIIHKNNLRISSNDVTCLVKHLMSMLYPQLSLPKYIESLLVSRKQNKIKTECSFKINP